MDTGVWLFQIAAVTVALLTTLQPLAQAAEAFLLVMLKTLRNADKVSEDHPRLSVTFLVFGEPARQIGAR